MRVRHICTKVSDFQKHTVDIIHHYAKRGYLIPLLTEKLELVLRKDRHTLLHPLPPPPKANRPEQDSLFCVVTYHP